MKTSSNSRAQEPKAIPETDDNKTVNNTTFTLLHPDYKNEMFNQNLAYLKVRQPELYNAVVKHQCKEYRLCSTPDGIPNILHMQSKQLIYAAHTMEDILSPIQQNIDNLSCNSVLPANILNSADERWKNNNPIQVKMMDGLYKGGIFHKMKISSDNLGPLQGYSTDYLPLIRVYGIGLGFHLTELIKKKQISYMTVYEPHLDLFYTSLFTIPWQLIFKYFEINNKGISLAVGTTPDKSIESNQAFIQQRLLPLTSFFYRFKHFNSSAATDEIIDKEAQTDELQRQQSDLGWYEDQRIGFYFSAKNISRRNHVFSGQKTKQYFRAFIVGSGPSLNESIAYIKEMQNDAIIISCGTALTPLTMAGIIPDYQVTQERDWHFHQHEEKHDLSLLKKISLLKLNVVSPKIDKHYGETLVFQKLNDPGSTLLDNSYAVTASVNPTVTNAGISMAAELGVNEVYLFGVDYGAPVDAKTMHASNTIYESSQVFDDSLVAKTLPDLPGNLGAVIRTNLVLSWSHSTTENRIARHPDIQWFNVAEGALIAGAIPIETKDLPAKFSRKIQKQHLREEISHCFNNQYSPDIIVEKLRTEQLHQVEQYLQAIIGFTDSLPQTREEIVQVLSLLYKAVNTGGNQTHFLPTSLLSFGFKQFINNVYIQTAIEKDDTSAREFFKTAKKILLEYSNDIMMDMERILSSIESDSELEFYS